MSEILQIPITQGLVLKLTLNDLILLATFLALLWYAWATHRLKNETVRQNELNICPIILVDLGREGFVYKNRGRGVALNIETENVIFNVIDPPKTYNLIFNKINNILVNEQSLVRGKVLNEEGNDIGGFDIFFAHFDPIVAEFDFEIPILYTDIFGTPYETILGCGKGGIRIIKFERKKKGLINCLRKKLC